MKYVYYRDGVETSHGDWMNALKEDIGTVKSKTTCESTQQAIEMAIRLDIAEGRGSTVNGHSYSQRANIVI